MIYRNYSVGTVIRRRNGYNFVKTRDGWKAEHRMIAELKLVDRELEPGEKVFHLDNTLRGEDGFNDKNNLAVIKFRTTKWTNFVKSKILYVPDKEPVKYKDFVINKK